MNATRPPTEAPASTLVIQTAFLGDVVLTMPLLMALADRYGPVDVVTTPQAAPLLVAHPAVDRVIPYDKRGADRGIGPWVGLARRIRARSYQRVFLPHRSWRSAALVLGAGISDRVGFDDSPARLSYTRRVVRDTSLHETRRLLALAGTDDSHIDFGFTIGKHDTSAAQAWLADHGVTGPFVALAPGSVWGTKRWPGYAELAAAVPHQVVVVGGPAERGMAQDIVAAAGGRAVSAAGETTLPQSAAILARAGLLVSNDSAPLHLAGAVGTRVVAVFGPTVPAFGFGPLGPDDVIVEADGLECRPCSHHGPMTCPLGHHRCMTDLSVDRVMAAVTEVWRKTGNRNARTETS